MLKTLGQFENLGFVIMSTWENIRLIARAPLRIVENWCKHKPEEITGELPLLFMLTYIYVSTKTTGTPFHQ